MQDDEITVRRIPKNYDGNRPTGRQVKSLLPKVLAKIQSRVDEKPELIIEAWKSVIGEKLSPMIDVLGFSNGVLFVKVKNASLYSILSVQEKPRLLKQLQQRLPNVSVTNIVFRVG